MSAMGEYRRRIGLRWAGAAPTGPVSGANRAGDADLPSAAGNRAKNVSGARPAAGRAPPLAGAVTQAEHPAATTAADRDASAPERGLGRPRPPATGGPRLRGNRLASSAPPGCCRRSPADRHDADASGRVARWTVRAGIARGASAACGVGAGWSCRSPHWAERPRPNIRLGQRRRGGTDRRPPAAPTDGVGLPLPPRGARGRSGGLVSCPARRLSTTPRLPWSSVAFFSLATRGIRQRVRDERPHRYVAQQRRMILPTASGGRRRSARPRAERSRRLLRHVLGRSSDRARSSRALQDDERRDRRPLIRVSTDYRGIGDIRVFDSELSTSGADAVDGDVQYVVDTPASRAVMVRRAPSPVSSAVRPLVSRSYRSVAISPRRCRRLRHGWSAQQPQPTPGIAALLRIWRQPGKVRVAEPGLVVVTRARRIMMSRSRSATTFDDRHRCRRTCGTRQASGDRRAPDPRQPQAGELQVAGCSVPAQNARIPTPCRNVTRGDRRSAEARLVRPRRRALVQSPQWRVGERP